MAKLSQFRVDAKAVEEGAWISPGEEYADLEIRTRGITDQYSDARNAKLRRAAVRFGGNPEKIPAGDVREITVTCLIEHLLLDVRNIVDDAGAPVSFAQFCDMLHTRDYIDLVLACIKAAAIVGLTKANEIEDAKKN